MSSMIQRWILFSPWCRGEYGPQWYGGGYCFFHPVTGVDMSHTDTEVGKVLTLMEEFVLTDTEMDIVLTLTQGKIHVSPTIKQRWLLSSGWLRNFLDSYCGA
jgi:hypothetical protein